MPNCPIFRSTCIASAKLVPRAGPTTRATLPTNLPSESSPYARRQLRVIRRRLSIDPASPPPRSSHCSQNCSRPVPGSPAPAPNCSHNTVSLHCRGSVPIWPERRLLAVRRQIVPALGPQPIPVHYWLDQLIPELTGQGITDGVIQGQVRVLRQLLHGELRQRLLRSSEQMPSLDAIVSTGRATLRDHYAAALACCCKREDIQRCHREASAPQRRPGEPLNLATTRHEQAFRAVSGPLAPGTHGLLTQERGLYRWPEHGWQRGAVARLCQRGAFSHVVAARRTHCSTPPPTTSVGCCYPLPLVPGSPGPPTRRLPAGPPLWPGPPTLPFSLVGGSSQPGPPAGPGSEVAVEIAISQNVRVCDSLCGLSEAAKDSRCNGPPTRRLRLSALAGPPRP